jgi:ribosome assembly protein 4
MATLYVPDSKRRRKDREELALNAPSGPENRVNIIAQLEDAEGNPAGPQLDLPHDADPKQLEEVLNALLQNEDKVPFAFYAADAEITGTLGEHLRKRDASVESILKIVYQPQALFRVRPVTRCSSAIPGHAEAVLSVAFSPDGKNLASGSGDTTVRMWNHETGDPQAHVQRTLQLGPLHRVVPRRHARRQRLHGQGRAPVGPGERRRGRRAHARAQETHHRAGVGAGARPVSRLYD